MRAALGLLRPFRAHPVLTPLIPGLAPWAFLRNPSGVGHGSAFHCLNRSQDPIPITITYSRLYPVTAGPGAWTSRRHICNRILSPFRIPVTFSMFSGRNEMARLRRIGT